MKRISASLIALQNKLKRAMYLKKNVSFEVRHILLFAGMENDGLSLDISSWEVASFKVPASCRFRVVS